MKIAIDLRSLQSGGISGVENYILNVVEHMVPKDQKNSYTLFYNSLRPGTFEHLKFINARTVKTRIPNRLLNFSLKFVGQPTFQRLVGDFDVLFLPNFNQYAIKPGTKLVVTVHDMSPVVTPEFYDTKRRLWHHFLNIRKILQRADLIIAVSNFTKQDLVKLYDLPENKIKVIYPGIDHSLFKPDLSVDRLRAVRNRYGLPGDFLLYVGTLEPRKNLSGLIAAFDQLSEPISLVIAGKQGWKYDKILEILEASPKRRLIKYLGYIPDDDKPYIIKLAKALVWPSYYEGFGFPPLEALGVGTPVVTSQVTSLPEVAGQAALMVNPYNVNDLAKAISQVLSDPGLRANLIEAGFKQARRFNWEQTAAQTLEALNQL